MAKLTVLTLLALSACGGADDSQPEPFVAPDSAAPDAAPDAQDAVTDAADAGPDSADACVPNAPVACTPAHDAYTTCDGYTVACAFGDTCDDSTGTVICLAPDSGPPPVCAQDALRHDGQRAYDRCEGGAWVKVECTTDGGFLGYCVPNLPAYWNGQNPCY